MYALAFFPQSSRGGNQERGPSDTHDTSDTQSAAVFYLANWEDAPCLTLTRRVRLPAVQAVGYAGAPMAPHPPPA